MSLCTGYKMSAKKSVCVCGIFFFFLVCVVLQEERPLSSRKVLQLNN